MIAKKRFGASKQQIKDIESFISVGSAVVPLLKQYKCIEENIKQLNSFKEQLESNIRQIKISMEQYVKAYGNKSKELDTLLDQKEKEYEEICKKINSYNGLPEVTLHEIDNYFEYLEHSPYMFSVYDQFLSMISSKVSYWTKDELFTVLIVILSVKKIFSKDSREYKASEKAINELYELCKKNNEEEYASLVSSFENTEDIEDYIKENYLT